MFSNVPHERFESLRVLYPTHLTGICVRDWFFYRTVVTVVLEEESKCRSFLQLTGLRLY